MRDVARAAIDLRRADQLVVARPVLEDVAVLQARAARAVRAAARARHVVRDVDVVVLAARIGHGVVRALELHRGEAHRQAHELAEVGLPDLGQIEHADRVVDAVGDEQPPCPDAGVRRRAGPVRLEPVGELRDGEAPVVAAGARADEGQEPEVDPEVEPYLCGREVLHGLPPGPVSHSGGGGSANKNGVELSPDAARRPHHAGRRLARADESAISGSRTGSRPPDRRRSGAGAWGRCRPPSGRCRS
jgi:hypothetical protein